MTLRDNHGLETLTVPYYGPQTESPRCRMKPNQRDTRLSRLVHNHPGGDPTPSQADIEMTKQIVEIARGLGIEVHDHLIVGRDGHVSLRGTKLM